MDKLNNELNIQSFEQVLVESRTFINYHANILCERIKSILVNKDQTEYRGDFKSGKKLNIKKIMPFIASGYWKNKIWMKKQESEQIKYWIIVALDDTISM